MLISTKGRYALRVMLELAQGEPGECMPLPVIAQRQGISEKYLESIIAVLARDWSRGSAARAAATASAGS